MNETEAIKSALIKTTVERYIEVVQFYNDWQQNQDEDIAFCDRKLTAAALSVIASLMIDEKVDFIYLDKFKNFGVN